MITRADGLFTVETMRVMCDADRLYYTPLNIVTREVAAKLLGISEKTLANRKSLGMDPPTVGHGRYRLEDLATMLNQSQQTAA